MAVEWLCLFILTRSLNDEFFEDEKLIFNVIKTVGIIKYSFNVVRNVS